MNSDRLADSPGTRRETFVRFALIFLPLVVLTGGAVAALYWYQDRSERVVVELGQRNHVNLLSEIIVADFKSVVSDLMFLSDGRTLAVLLDDDSPAARRALSEEYRRFLQHKGIYDQVRFIDVAGMEIARVNAGRGEAVVVPDEKLQAKNDRYYVIDTLKFARGEVFVSPLDLNVEEGRIEQPPKPTIRFATPVFDRAGRKRGIVVINYLGANLIGKLKSASAGATGQAMLLNAEGYWLTAPDVADEFGFMYPDKAERTFGRRFPVEWDQISADKNGAILTADGLFAFGTVYPIDRLATQRATASESDGPHTASSRPSYFWKIVSRLDPESLAAPSRGLLIGLARMYAGLVAILAMVSWLLARTTIQHRRARTKLLESERLAAVGETMAALAHESRNALQRSQAGLDMLAKRIQNQPESLELLSEIQAAQYHLRDLYEEVRGYATTPNLRCQTADLGQLARETWDQLAVRRHGRQVRFVERSSATSLDCSIDRPAIGQVIRNILENSLDATLHGGGNQPEFAAEIVLDWCDADLDGRPALRVGIRDNGSGLGEQERQRIFEPFFTTKVHGTGLGMAIARRIVEAHGGRISAATNCPHGTEIVVVLPRRQPARH